MIFLKLQNIETGRKSVSQNQLQLPSFDVLNEKIDYFLQIFCSI